MKNFILQSKDINKSSFIWNMCGSMLMAFQSIIFLIVLTHTAGIVEAGIFTIANATANLFLNIGIYGMRNYQASDVTDQFTFSEYLSSRHISFAAMLIFSIVYLTYTSINNQYSLHKVLVILWMCLYKSIDSLEDVYHAEYQKLGRLDIAGKCMTFRMIFNILLFIIILLASGSQLTALIITTILSSIILYIFTNWTKHIIPESSYKTRKRKQVLKLLKTCLPLFCSLFLSFYIGNAPKYSIDRLLNDQSQACYGFISMPVFIINLLSLFIFSPIIFRMSCLWTEKKLKKFAKNTLLQILGVSFFTLICIIGAYLIGIPVLSIMYNTDLSCYKSELLILLLGGGFLGLSALLRSVITIMRLQKHLTLGYMIVSFIALITSDSIIKSYGISGASILYTLLMAALSFYFLILFISGMISASRQTP